MTATDAQVSKLRRYIDEPTEDTYSDDELKDYIESYAVMDELGTEPWKYDESTEPPTRIERDNWIPTYDLHAAAADIWEEKAAAVADEFDFEADGGDYKRSQKHEAYMANARRHKGRSFAKSVGATT